MKKIAIIYGTRPEAIKLVKVINLLKNDKNIKLTICSTGQHKEMLDQVHGDFDVVPDFDFGVMRANQSLIELTQNLFKLTADFLLEKKPDLVIVHGDTTSAFCASLAAFYLSIPVAHIEAGLRTNAYRVPFPEEFNRRTIANLAEIHFAPTDRNKINLLDGKVDSSKVFVTGNTAIDSLQHILKTISDDDKKVIYEAVFKKKLTEQKFVIITAHRRENLANGISNILEAVKALAVSFPDIDFLYPVHLNPLIRNSIKQIGDLPDNVFLHSPISYRDFCALLQMCTLVMTDSGGLQEEAPSLNKPVVVLREETERVEGLKAGTLILTGVSVKKIIHTVSLLLSNEEEYNRVALAKNPYGDGSSANKIVQQILKFFN